VLKPMNKTTMSKEEIDSIIKDIKNGKMSKSEVIQKIDETIFEKHYYNTLKEKCEKIYDTFPSNSNEWKNCDGEEYIVIKCVTESLNREELIILEPIILNFFDYTIKSLNDNKMSITFTENIYHKRSMRIFFVI
jgi:hypothetical protein